MKIIDLLPDNQPLMHQAAQLLVDAFRDHWPNAWPRFEDGMERSA